ncbi:hypothetical protein ColKHC_05929 [Colletotrichum higginsianum]|nr:hypothetical protein ColKHC_05929 [Colletotrichum higginsianum]
MSQKLIPQNPDDVMVIRDLTPNITTFSVPFSRFGAVKIGGRGTLVRLSSGALAVFSPVALTDAVRAKIAEKGGDLAYIVAPDIEHHIFLSEYKAAFPAARLIGPDGLPQKRAKQTGDPKINPSTPTLSTILQGAEGERDTSSGLANRLFGSLQTTEGDVKWVKRFQWYVMSSKDRPSFNDSIRRIEAWDFDTIVPCHGDTIQGDGKERFRKVFEWHLAGEKH